MTFFHFFDVVVCVGVVLCFMLLMSWGSLGLSYASKSDVVGLSMGEV